MDAAWVDSGYVISVNPYVPHNSAHPRIKQMQQVPLE